jgi:hypothetical protein
LDATNLDETQRTRIKNWWIAFEKLFFDMVEFDRRNNSYCAPLGHYTSDRGDRYRALNMLAYESHKTLEVRMHHGTVKADEIISWIRILLWFFESAKDNRISLTRARTISRLPYRELRTRLITEFAPPRPILKLIAKRLKRYQSERKGPRPCVLSPDSSVPSPSTDTPPATLQPGFSITEPSGEISQQDFTQMAQWLSAQPHQNILSRPLASSMPLANQLIYFSDTPANLPAVAAVTSRPSPSDAEPQ